ncbi:MAG: 23S rRNA (guanosine(2251)-2'-O)-methyltransferase RlmB [Fuerstiella sp.]
MARSSGNRKSRRRQLQASHQKNWLTGRYAILETMKAGRWPVDELFVAEDEFAKDKSISDQIETLADAADVRVYFESSDRIAELCHSTHHQGVAARMGPFPYESLQWLQNFLTTSAATADAVGTLPLVVVCDRIQDTFNFGAILRCCDAMQVAAVLIGDSEQATVTPQVSRSSAGAVNHVPIVLCEDLNLAVGMLKASGLLIAAASEKATEPAWAVSLKAPTALIVGSESDGVSANLLALCDAALQIPMLGQVESLNAAVAAGIMLYEIRRQQHSGLL